MDADGLEPECEHQCRRSCDHSHQIIFDITVLNLPEFGAKALNAGPYPIHYPVNNLNINIIVEKPGYTLGRTHKKQIVQFVHIKLVGNPPGRASLCRISYRQIGFLLYKTQVIVSTMSATAVAVPISRVSV